MLSESKSFVTFQLSIWFIHTWLAWTIKKREAQYVLIIAPRLEMYLKYNDFIYLTQLTVQVEAVYSSWFIASKRRAGDARDAAATIKWGKVLNAGSAHLLLKHKDENILENNIMFSSSNAAHKHAYICINIIVFL